MIKILLEHNSNLNEIWEENWYEKQNTIY
jgi:hypothetical protein